MLPNKKVTKEDVRRVENGTDYVSSEKDQTFSKRCFSGIGQVCRSTDPRLFGASPPAAFPSRFAGK